MKFSINQTYNGITWRVLTNQQLKSHTQVKDRDSSKCVSLFSSFVKKRTFPVFPVAVSIVL